LKRDVVEWLGLGRHRWVGGGTLPLRYAKRLSVDIAVPVYRGNIHEVAMSVHRQLAYYQEHLDDFDWNIVVAINGPSADAVCREAEELSKSDTRVRWTYTAQQGKGAGVINTWRESPAAIQAYVDVDLASDLGSLCAALQALRDPQIDIAVASRYHPQSKVKRSWRRRIISIIYHWFFLRWLLRVRFTDGQCGSKAVTSRVTREVLPLVKNREWFFESELLVLSERNGFRIHEVPVTWHEGSISGVVMLKAIPQFIAGVIRLMNRKIPRGISDEELANATVTSGDAGRRFAQISTGLSK